MDLKTKYQRLSCWGLLASVDVYHCAPELIRRPGEIRKFIRELCASIKMKRYGKAMIEKFGQGDLLGYSALQFIETSSITMHFDEVKNRAFIEIFSCKYFDPKQAEAFCRRALKGRSSKLRYYLRH